MSSAVSWDVEEREQRHPALRIRKGLVDRGRRRRRPGTDENLNTGAIEYVVRGEDRFNDTRPLYLVRWDGEAGQWHCTCMEGVGGEYRTRGCSHVGAVVVEITERDGVDPWGLRAPYEPAARRSAVVPVAEPGTVPGPGDPFWGSLPWPEWVRGFRPHQEQAFLEIVEAFKSGKKVVILDAPTGSGKTLLAEMVRRGLGGPDGRSRMNFTCTTKSLQEQILRDFGYARMLQGRANYPTANYPHLFKAGDWSGTNCGDCEMATPEDDCSLCPGVSDCPYTAAKIQATTAPVAVLNSAYVLREWMGQRSRFRKAGLTVMDEADELELALMGLVEVSISPRQQSRLGMKPPAKKTVESSWIEWAQEAIPQVRAMTAALRAHAKDNVRARRDLKHYEGLLANLKLMAEELGQGLWVYDGGTKPGDWIRFKPVKVDRYGRQFIWDNDERFLLMSASVVSAQHMAESLGLLDDEWVEVHVPSTFPPENRPVYPLRIANVVASNKDAAYPAVADAISGILDMHPDERVLVHTVSYDLTRFLFERLWGGVDTDRRPVFAYMAAADRQQALSNYIAKERAVLLAPSFERGIDLPDELCRVMVIAKVPYPNLGDKQVSARLHTKGGELWYRVATVRSIVQMTGRGVRHAQDQAVTYVLDSQFLDNVWKRSRLLLPKWWREALVTDVGAIARRIKRGR